MISTFYDMHLVGWRPEGRSMLDLLDEEVSYYLSVM